MTIGFERHENGYLANDVDDILFLSKDPINLPFEECRPLHFLKTM
jgi:hypothetical protein